MKAFTNIQILNWPDGKPAFVVLPYDEYVRTYKKEKNLIPNAVVRATVNGATPVRAWREHLKLTQAEVAHRLEISQPAYAKQENSTSLRRTSLERIAVALSITTEQLDF